jgi:glycosyltransferase involved in cell wall biosynthesis
MIGFIIPSIGRETITVTLESLVNQTNPNWKCYVGFDGKEESDIDPSILVQDERIKYFYFGEKLGDETKHHGNAGQVRNSIIGRIDDDIEWIGFVDDDDTLSKYYVEILELEKNKKEFDCCVFRMRYDKDNIKILPPFNMDTIKQNFVGISFCVRRKFIDKNKISFVNDNAEDFKYLKKISDCNGEIHISSHITYNVNGYQYNGQK